MSSQSCCICQKLDFPAIYLLISGSSMKHALKHGELQNSQNGLIIA